MIEATIAIDSSVPEEEYKQFTWPTMFVGVPHVGDRVQGDCGLADQYGVLSICRITHGVANNKPFIIVTLGPI